ncbi:MAG: helix-turn-helix domain-containing protein [Sulfitobacter sp.]
MSVSSVFGDNLRVLAEQRGTQAAAARDLGFSKVQFQRYLRGTSIPKPYQLKQICDYFDVNARVLLEPLTDDLLAEMRVVREGLTHKIARNGMLEAAEFACGSSDYYAEASRLPDGFYGMTRQSMVYENKFVRLLFFVKTLQTAQVLRGYDQKQMYSEEALPPQREYRGIIYPQQDGFSVVCHRRPPASWVVHMYFNTFVSRFGNDAYLGFADVGRAELPGRVRFARIYVEHLKGGLPEARAFMEVKAFPDVEELPPHIRSVITQPAA